MRRSRVILLVVGLAVVASEARRCAIGGRPAPPVDVSVEPEQEAVEPPTVLTLRRDDRDFRLTFTHRYAVSGKVVSAWAYDWAWTSDFFDVDLGLIWGPRVDWLEEHFTFRQNARWLFWQTDRPVSAEERALVTRSMGNQHLIPAEGRSGLDRAIRSAEEGDLVRIEGWLVAIHDDAGLELARSSTRREDSGGGACEIVYVERFQKNGRLWD